MIISNVSINYNSNSPLNGAFAFLQNTYRKTKISEDVVKVRTKTGVNNLALPIEDKTFDDIHWRSETDTGSWYEVDFLQNNL